MTLDRFTPPVYASWRHWFAWSIRHSRQCMVRTNSQDYSFVGTYFRKSEGIYGYHMDVLTGALTRFTSIKSVNPSFLTIDRSKRFLYA